MEATTTCNEANNQKTDKIISNARLTETSIKIVFRKDVSCDKGSTDSQTCSCCCIERVLSESLSGSSPVIAIVAISWTLLENIGFCFFGRRTSVVLPGEASWIQTECLKHVFFVPCLLGSSEVATLC